VSARLAAGEAIGINKTDRFISVSLEASNVGADGHNQSRNPTAKPNHNDTLAGVRGFEESAFRIGEKLSRGN
jgi:hypothetical protein